MLTVLVRLQVIAALVIIPIHFMDSINPKREAAPPVANPAEYRGAEAVQSAWNAVKSQYGIPSADGRFRRPSFIQCDHGVWTIEGQVETERGLISYKKQVRTNKTHLWRFSLHSRFLSGLTSLSTHFGFTYGSAGCRMWPRGFASALVSTPVGSRDSTEFAEVGSSRAMSIKFADRKR